MNARVRITRPDGRSITVDVAGAETPHDGAHQIADFIRDDVFFSSEHHEHNDTVRSMLEDAASRAAGELDAAMERVRIFHNETAGL